MRGSTTRQVTFLSVTTDQLVAPDHPIRRVKPFVEACRGHLFVGGQATPSRVA
jgi:hypothetical protein